MRSVPGAVIRADEHDVSDPSRDQLHPTEDQGPHEDVAQLAVGLHERQQMFAIDFDDLARLADTEADERAAAGQHAHLAGEPARANRHQRFLGAVRQARDINPSRHDHKKAGAVVADIDEDLALADLPRAPVGRHPRKLRRRQGWKQAIGKGGRRLGKGRCRLSHGEEIGRFRTTTRRAP